MEGPRWAEARGRPSPLDATGRSTGTLWATGNSIVSPPASRMEATWASQAHAEELMTSPHVHRRWLSSQSIGRLGEMVSDEGVAALSKTLTHKDSEGFLRWQTAKSLGSLGHHAGSKSATSLAQVLLQRKPGQPGAEVYVRCGVASSIAKLGEAASDKGVFALTKALETERSNVVRQRAAAALGELGVHAGEVGAKTLMSALKKDEDVIVRYRCAEALGQIGRGIGEAGAAALAAALAGDKVDGVRLRAAAALGVLADLPGEPGAQALLKASMKDTGLAVRNQCLESLDEMGRACAKALNDVSGDMHSFVRGRCAKILSLVGARLPDRALEILAVNLINDSDQHIRRRAAEALHVLGAVAGELGAASLRRANEEDSDVYVEWVTSQALGSLNLIASQETFERLDRLIEEDLLRRPRGRLSAAELALQARKDAAAVAEDAAEAAVMAFEEDSRRRTEAARQCQRVARAFLAGVLLMQLHQEAMWASEEAKRVYAPTISAEEADLADQGALGSIIATIDFDDEHMLAAFKKMAAYGEISAEPANLLRVLKMVGHQNVNAEVLDMIVKEEMCGRSFLDEEDFMNFVNSYETRRQALLEEQFRTSDLDGSGLIDAEELEGLLRRLGITPGTGVVPELIQEVCGQKGAEVSFENYVKIHTILHERSGFTRREYGRLRLFWIKVETSGTGLMNNLMVRAALSRQGFKLELAEVDKMMAKATKNRVDLLGEENLDPGSINEVEYLRISRLVREQEANKLLKTLKLGSAALSSSVLNEDQQKRGAEAINEDDEEEDQDVVNVVTAEELPELLLELGNAPLLPEDVKEFMRASGYREDREMTVEDLCPLLEKIREVEGFCEIALEEVQSIFRKFDADGSKTMSGLELEKAIRWTGFPVDFAKIQSMLEEHDIDNTGELDDAEFLQVMGQLRKAEIDACGRHIERERDKPEGSLCQTDDDLVHRVPSFQMKAVLKDLGHEPLLEDSATLKSCMAASSTAAAEARERGEWQGPDAEVNVWGMARLIRKYRKEVRDRTRKLHGFTEKQAEKLKWQFDHYDPDGSGSIKQTQLRALLAKLFEGTRSKQAQDLVVKVLRDIDEDGSGSVEFFEFLALMRVVRDNEQAEKQEMERKAVEDTKFARDELRQFREVFRTFDTDDSGDMDFDELQQMVALLVGGQAMGDKGAKELRVILEAADEDGSGVMDFPEFLRILRMLVDQNWRGFSDRLSAAVGEVAGEGEEQVP